MEYGEKTEMWKNEKCMFSLILGSFMDYYSPFCGPEAISIVFEPQVVVMCRSSTLAVLADSGPFRGLLLTILGSEVISTINEPWGAFTCWSSTLVVFVDSGPFHALLHTVLGSQSDFHDWRSPGCVYVSIVNTHSFGQFWPVSWTITHCFAGPKRFP